MTDHAERDARSTADALLAAFTAADAEAKAAVWPYADGFTHRRLKATADALRKECIERGLDWESVAAPSQEMNPYGHARHNDGLDA